MNYVKMSVIFSDLQHHDESPVSCMGVQAVARTIAVLGTCVCVVHSTSQHMRAQQGWIKSTKSTSEIMQILKRNGHGALSPRPGLLFFSPTKNLRCQHSKEEEYWIFGLPSLVLVSKLGCGK